MKQNKQNWNLNPPGADAIIENNFVAQNGQNSKKNDSKRNEKFSKIKVQNKKKITKTREREREKEFKEKILYMFLVLI